MAKPFTVKFIGKTFDLDGGEANFVGPSGTLGDYETFNLAFQAATAQVSEQSWVEIYDFNSEERGTAVFRCDGEYLRTLRAR